MQNWNENIFSFFFFSTVSLHKYSVNYLRNESISPRENYSKHEVEWVCEIFSLYRAIAMKWFLIGCDSPNSLVSNVFLASIDCCDDVNRFYDRI